MAIIDKPSDYFNTVLYSGTGSTQSITGVGFQPDLIWGKNRSATGSHNLVDSVRGVSKVIYSNLTDAEATDTSSYNAFGSDGFTMGSQSNINGSGNNIVSWNWKAGTSFTNDASATGIGTIDSTGSVNTTSGFSVITFTGDGNADATVAHGLGVAPKMVIVKSRSAATGWFVYHASLTTGDNIYLDDTGAPFGGSYVFDVTSTVFKLRDHTAVNGNGVTFVAYCFAEKQGYSKFGSYTGNGDADGTFVYTGFKPAFVMNKKTDGTMNWHIWDNKRNSYNIVDKLVYPNLSNAEDTLTSFDFVSNGFKIRDNRTFVNASGSPYIYMAFAENPFTTSTGVPATAR
jgi:hypothetical protein